MTSRTGLLLAVCLALGGTACKKAHKAAPAPTPVVVKPMAPEEVQRSEDACKAYVERACACTAPEAAKQCQLAKGQPDAMRVALEVAANPASSPEVVRQSYDSVRKTVKSCIEETAKLPQLGCN